MMSASTTFDRCALPTEIGWYARKRKADERKIARAAASISMSQYQSCRSRIVEHVVRRDVDRPVPPDGTAAADSPFTGNGPGRWSLLGVRRAGGSQAPVGSGAVRASGKSAALGAMPGTNAESQIGSLPHCVTYFL